LHTQEDHWQTWVGLSPAHADRAGYLSGADNTTGNPSDDKGLQPLVLNFDRAGVKSRQNTPRVKGNHPQMSQINADGNSNVGHEFIPLFHRSWPVAWNTA